jgi:hypothetical protein
LHLWIVLCKYILNATNYLPWYGVATSLSPIQVDLKLRLIPSTFHIYL